jgi:hypothetical protein
VKFFLSEHTYREKKGEDATKNYYIMQVDQITESHKDNNNLRTERIEDMHSGIKNEEAAA